VPMSDNVTPVPLTPCMYNRTYLATRTCAPSFRSGHYCSSIIITCVDVTSSPVSLSTLSQITSGFVQHGR